MTITSIVDIGYRPYGAYADPSLPAGLWIGGGVVVGDASGGDRQIRIIFALASQLRVSSAFSLEQVTMDLTDNSAQGVEFRCSNLDKDVSDVTGRNLRFVLATAGASAGDSFLPLRELSGLPFWLGRQSGSNIETSMTLIIPNTDGEEFSATCQGYYWSQRSISVPSGPRRPVGGFYKA